MAIRNPERGKQHKQRITLTFRTILVCYAILMARLVYLQGIYGTEIRKAALQSREKKIPSFSRRGCIYDMNGALFATSLYDGVVGFDPIVTFAAMAKQDPRTRAKLEERLQKGVPKIADLLNMPIPELQSLIADIRQSLDQPPASTPPKSTLPKSTLPKSTLPKSTLPKSTLPKRRLSRFVTIQKGISLETANAIREAHVPGFGVRDNYHRVYASGADAAHVIGRMDAQGQGQLGLELGCETLLHGVDGHFIAELDDRRREIPETARDIVSERNGYDIHTTLDSNAQHIATEEAAKIVQQYRPRGVSIVILDPSTGDIRALVSMPNFDPSPEHRNDLASLPKEEWNEHFRDRCASSLYEPGSTLKALTIAAALDQGIVTMSDTFYCSGEMKVARKTIHCAHGEVHGEQSLEDILRHSCNIGAAEIGIKMTAKKLYAAEQKFGLLDSLPIPLPGTGKGRWSFDRNEQRFNDAKAARVAFGHSIATTPLHVALAYAAIANGGTLMKPRLITEITDGTKVIKKFEPQAERRVISPHTSRLLTGMLRSVVSNGTAKAIATRGYQFAGKTGTAKKYRPDKYVGSFIGFLPASPETHPRLVILVAVDEPQGDKYYGGEVAAPAFQSIATQLAQYWQIPPDDPWDSQYNAAQENIKHPEKIRLHDR